MSSPGDGAVPVASAVRRVLAPLIAQPATSAIVTDFDGTLAPIVDDPAGARALEGTADLLALLARRYAVVAVVSGRSVSFLSERLFPVGQKAPETWASSIGSLGIVQLVGLYGLEWSEADGTIIEAPGAGRWRSVVDQVASQLESAAPTGVEVENKGLAVTLHWRRAPEAAAWAADEVASLVADSGLRAHPGRMSVELRAPLDVDKGTATRRLIEGCSAACFLGDDIGDLPAFALLANLAGQEGMATVAVAVVDNESAPSVVEAADVVIAGPEEALSVLRWLAEGAGESDGG
jgi:trehalose 6-phosphate phosphatase